MHGLAIHQGALYLATAKEIFRATIQADGSLDEPVLLLGDLPDGGQHPNRTLASGPDGMLYVSVGSSCNACNETNPSMADPAAGLPGRQVAHDLRQRPAQHHWLCLGSGYRRAVGHGPRYRLPRRPGQPEELNHLVKGKQYGWPHVCRARAGSIRRAPRRAN